MAGVTGEVDFALILAELDADKELQEAIRERQKELDQASRSILTILNKIHSTPSSGGEYSEKESRTLHDRLNALVAVQSIVLQAVPIFAQSRAYIRAIIMLVPDNQYYKVR